MTFREDVRRTRRTGAGASVHGGTDISQTPASALRYPQLVAIDRRALDGYIHHLTDPPVEAQAVVAAESRARVSGGVAVVPITGYLEARPSMMGTFFGATATLPLRNVIQQLARDRSVGTIVLDMDTPGGEISGTIEAADAVAEAAKQKKVIAVANPWALSAGYWIASQASLLVAAPSGEVGSIGVLSLHLDDSAAQEAAGLKLEIVSAGKYKDEGWQGPLSDDARAAEQDNVDRLYGMFTAAVAKGRGTTRANVEAGYGEGRAVMAEPARRMGMIDKIEPLDVVLGRLTGDAAARRMVFLGAARVLAVLRWG